MGIKSKIYNEMPLYNIWRLIFIFSIQMRDLNDINWSGFQVCTCLLYLIGYFGAWLKSVQECMK